MVRGFNYWWRVFVMALKPLTICHLTKKTTTNIETKNKNKTKQNIKKQTKQNKNIKCVSKELPHSS